MSDVGRGFVAVVPPAPVLDEVEKRSEALELPGTARRMARDQWHLTLHFLGNRVDFDAYGAALTELAMRPGRIRFGGAGAFPSPRRARILWVGVTEGTGYLAQLAAAVGALLGPLGYEPEARPFHAHLTLARLKAPTDVRPVIAALGADPVGEAWTADAVVLFRSSTLPTGARHAEHTRVALAGGPDASP